MASRVSRTFAASSFPLNGFSRNADPGVSVPFLVDDLVGVARHEEDAHVREQLAHPLCQGRAAELGHDQVGEQQVDLATVPFGDLRRFGRSLGRDHLVALLFEDPRG